MAVQKGCGASCTAKRTIRRRQSEAAATSLMWSSDHVWPQPGTSSKRVNENESTLLWKSALKTALAKQLHRAD